MTVHRVRTDQLFWVETDGEIVALDERTSEYLAFNSTGALLFLALVQGATTEHLVSLLKQRCGVGTAVVRDDVQVFLGDLSGRGLLVRP